RWGGGRNVGWGRWGRGTGRLCSPRRSPRPWPPAGAPAAPRGSRSRAERSRARRSPNASHENLTTVVVRGTNLPYRALVIVHLVDGTYELFRYFLSPAAAFERTAPEELRAVRGVVTSMLGMLEGGATHLGVATDHVIESFRNGLWPGYKTGEGVDPLLLAQFEPLEDALRALGVTVWAMVEFEADDALAAAASMASADARVEQVVVCTPDKDLAQCVRSSRVVQLDRRTREVRDESGVQQKFGVLPA